MSTTLCLDLGNTRLKWAVFSDGEIRYRGILRDDGVEDLRKCIYDYRPDKSIISSVVDHPSEFEDILKGSTKFHKLDHYSRVPITTPVAKPETIGADRLALVVAATHYFPQKNNLVIGLGSAVTYNYINRMHQFIGGSISPGMEMRFKSLETFTAKLPLVKPHWNFPLMGYDTKTNIQSGVIFGMAKEMDGFIDAYEERYDNLHVLMTGGDAEYFVPFMKNRITHDPDLIFKGLYVISEYNFST
ncbi:MAG: type III pantothenate kinase [Bacteroidota bacterium]|nr:type III pantothenate kinase [Bacteroidota bacterium]